MSNKFVWEYFQKIDLDHKRAVCKLCKNVYSYKATSHNLISHLKKKHKDKTDEISLRLKLSKETVSALWDNFTKLDDHKKVLCKLCNNFIPFNRYLSALKKHLADSHRDTYDKLNENHLQCDDFYEEEYLIPNEDSNDSNTSDVGIWNYFERQQGGVAKCVVCRAIVVNSTKDLKRHLKNNHPKLFSELFLEEDNDDGNSDTETDKNEGEIYTEVVYLDSEKQKRKTKTNSIAEKRKRRVSTSSDEMLIHSAKNKSTDEMEIFTAYITCLLKKMPKDACMKVQMEIINLIMNANLKLTHDSSDVVINKERATVETNPIQTNMPGVSYVLIPQSSMDMNRQHTFIQPDRITINTSNNESIDNNVENKIISPSFSNNGYTCNNQTENSK